MAETDTAPIELVREPTATMTELPMYLQRPSSSRSQDIRHILASTFREYYSKETVNPETIQKLSQSKGECEDEYHNMYVDSLRQVYEEHEKLMAESAMLERHIMQAQARAMSADEKALNRASSVCNNYDQLGLPPAPSCFQSCLDKELLKKHNLLVPSDYMALPDIIVPPPKKSLVPSHARDTQISNIRYSQILEKSKEGLRPDISKGILIRNLDDGEESEMGLGTLQETVTQKSTRHHHWKNQMTENQRETERTDLGLLEAKVNFLRNPRFDPKCNSRTLVKPIHKKPKETGIVDIPEPVKVKETTAIFVATPECVVFDNYVAGQIYQQTIALKNVSTVLRSCRVIPSETIHFYVDHGRFPGEHGLVAPGMSCIYTISFAPDSLSDYDDLLCVQTQATELKIHLRGRRPPPILSLPSNLHVGHCLLGGRRVSQFLVKNTGGSGKFCLLPQSAWPATNFKSAVCHSNLHIGMFEIHPVVFELLGGDNAVIEVVFSPTTLGIQSEQLIMVCDNCHISDLTLIGEGESPDVFLEYMEGGEKEPKLGDRPDPNADHYLVFDNLMPFTYTDRMIRVKNNNNVKLKFQWQIYKPAAVLDPNSDLPISEFKSQRVVDVNSVFGVYPQVGELPPGESSSFKVTFAPPVVGKFNNSLHLTLQDLPIQPPTHDMYLSETGVISPVSSKEIDTFSEQSSKATSRDVSIIEIDLKGESDPLNVVLKPYAVMIQGEVTIGSTVKKCFSMENYSVGLVKFHWEMYDLDHIIEVEPQIGELGPSMGMDFELKITGIYPGQLKHDLRCFIENLDTPLNLPVAVAFKGVEVSINQPDLNFGLVRLGGKVSREIVLCNKSQLCCKYAITEYDVTTKDATENQTQDKFTLTPMNGELSPLQEQTIVVTFQPYTAGVVSAVFEVQVQDGDNCFLSVFADVQTPVVSLEQCEVEPRDVSLNNVVTEPIRLHNNTLIPTVYHWGEPEGSDLEHVDVSIEPKHGSIDGRAVVECTLSVTAHKQIEITDLRLPCMIGGMDTPLYLSVACTVHGLSVYFDTSTDGCSREVDVTSDSKNLTLNFGDDVPLGATPKTYIHIRSESPIPAQYSIKVVSLEGRPPSPPSGQIIKSVPRGGMLRRTPNLADPSSKTPTQAHKDWCKLMLNNNKGAAFVPQVTEGIVKPYSEDIIEVIAFSDMWGTYTDSIVVKVDTLEPLIIPMTMTVVGSPLTFQALGPNPKNGLVIRMGTSSSGAPTTKRLVRINNNSPCDIRLDWRLYDTSQKSQGQEGIIELITYYGEAFPLKDETGTEIIPPPTAVCTPCHQMLHPNDISTTNLHLYDSSMSSIWSHHNSPCPSKQHSIADVYKNTKVVHLHMGVRNGVASSAPFTMDPDQIMVPRRGHAIANLWFDPSSLIDITEKYAFTGYALGYMSLADTDRENNYVTRKEAYDVDALSMELTATITPAMLSLSYAEDEGMLYRCCISELVGHEDDEVYKENTFILSNTTEMPLTFKMQMRDPFVLVDCDLWSNDINRYNLETELGTLFPRQSVAVKVAFRLSNDILEHVVHSAEATMVNSYADTRSPDTPSGTEKPDNASEKTGNATEYPSAMLEEGDAIENGSDMLENSDVMIKYTVPTENNTLVTDTEKPSGTLAKTTSVVEKTSGEKPNGWTEKNVDLMEKASGVTDKHSVITEKTSGMTGISVKTSDVYVDKTSEWIENDEYPNTSATIISGSRGDVFADDNRTDVASAITLRKRLTSGTGKLKRERFINVKKEVLISFTNGLHMTVPLHAIVFLPSLHLSLDAHDFGTCIVGQERKIYLTIKNTTKCDSYWSVRIESKSDTCTDRTFRLEPNNGLLKAQGSYRSDCKTAITLTFQAKHEELYEAVLVFGGMFGEEPKRLYVTGEGSYDEKHVAHLNA